MPAASGELCKFFVGNEDGAGLTLQALKIGQPITNGLVGGQIMVLHALYSSEDGHCTRTNLPPYAA